MDVSARDFHLTEKSSALNLAGSLAPAVYSNTLGENLDVLLEYREPAQTEPRHSLRKDRDLGAFQGPEGAAAP